LGTLMAMSKLRIALWAGSMLVGVVVLDRLAERFGVLAWLGSFELVHVLAHLFLYGTLAWLCLSAGASPRRAAAFTMGVALVQEGVQLVQRSRGPGANEAFDLAVDAVAVLAAAWLHRRGSRSDAAALPTVDDDARRGDPARAR
jgi:hypothetical protein